MATIIVIALVLLICLTVLLNRRYSRKSKQSVKTTNRSYDAWNRSRKMRLQ